MGNLEKFQSKVLKVFDDGGYVTMTIKQIKEYFLLLPIDQIPTAIETFKTDPRVGVQEISRVYENKYAAYVKERDRLNTMKEFDQVFTNNGQYLLVGVDEAGRGPLAGPVVAAAVVFPPDIDILGIDDSKKIGEDERERLYDEIMEKAISVGVGMVDSTAIDEINILQATFKAMREAIAQINVSPGVLLVDGNQEIPKFTSDTEQHAVIRGDSKSLSIAAASIIAKVTRDRIMVGYDEIYPDYVFKSNKGYGSPAHQWVIKDIGPSPIHRMTFIRNILKP